MLVSLSDVLTSEGKVETVAIPLEMTSFKSRQGDFSIMEKTPIHLTFTNIGVNKAKVTGTAELTFDTKCDRCLTEVPTAMKLKFDRIVYSPEAEAEVSEEEDTEQSFMDGWQLDVEAFVYDEILVNWPAKILSAAAGVVISFPVFSSACSMFIIMKREAFHTLLAKFLEASTLSQ